ncbi:MAG: cardiolipin synthase B [Acidobacteria bacterium]|nr:cardiolipin synthase B [Acidobacteriota bacterium]
MVESPVPSSLRLLADQAFSRAAGAPLVAGNRVTLLRDARENYPAWLDAIASATQWIHFETYIFYSDEAGRIFSEALAERARAGVRVRVLADWAGSLGKTSRRFWHDMRAAGVDVRLFNTPRLDSPLAWLSRDHRKMIAVDGRIAFVTGLCVGNQWVGDPERNLEPWRDTGVGLVGPAVADVEMAFTEAWAAAGPPLPKDEYVDRDALPCAGDAEVRVIASMPNTGGMLRVDQLAAALARRTLWVSDAYFVGVASYVEALRNAARDGVDVRLLVPGSGSDIAVVQRLTRAGYRVLLESGVRVFEWNGSMMHAKTAVADGHWARVGSTNLNLQSWLGNWELDVAVDDEAFGREMEAMFEEDLRNSTEIVLGTRNVHPAQAMHKRFRRGTGSRSRAAAGALRLGSTFSAALTARRPLGPAEASMLLYGAIFALVTAGVAVAWPALVAVPLGAFVAWLGMGWLVRAWSLYRGR